MAQRVLISSSQDVYKRYFRELLFKTPFGGSKWRNLQFPLKFQPTAHGYVVIFSGARADPNWHVASWSYAGGICHRVEIEGWNWKTGYKILLYFKIEIFCFFIFWEKNSWIFLKKNPWPGGASLWFSTSEVVKGIQNT